MNFLGHVKNLWSLGKIKLALAAIIFVSCVTAAYALIPYPYILDSGDASSPHKVTFSAPFTVHFSQSMSNGSVEENFKILPKIEGEFVWPDGKTLEFRPARNLTIGDEYRLIIGESAKSFFGKKIGLETTLRFIVTGPPYVKFTAPHFPNGGSNSGLDSSEPQSEQQSEPPSEIPIVSPNQIVTVMFDRPMEWADGQELLVTEPEVKGEYRFLGMSAFQFIPEAWPVGKNIKLTVSAGIPSRDGGKTEEEFVWNIETEPLRVIGSSPEAGDDKAKTDAVIEIRFNQPVELDQIKPGSNALLYPSNDLDAAANPKIDGFFNTEVTYAKDELGQTDKKILKFTPSFPYLPGIEYKFVLKAGITGPSAEADSIGMKKDFELAFKTAAEQGVASFTAPTEEWPSIFLKFNTAMTAEEIRKNLVITPAPLTPVGIILDQDSKEAEITCQFEPKKEYEVLFRAGALDITGKSIMNDFSASFAAPESSVKLRWETAGDKAFFMQGIDPEFSVISKNTERLSVELCKVTEGNFIETDQNHGWDKYRCYSEPYTVKISSKENQTTLLNLTALFKRDWESGIYYFSIADESGRKIYKIFLISDTSLVLKKSPDSALVWATDISTGEPVSRMELQVLGPDGIEMARGVTDGDGVYTITKNLGEGVYVVGEKTVENENRWAIANEYWNTPSSGTDSTSEWFYPGESRVFMSADNGTAYPGGQVNIKGIWRIDNDAQLTIPEEKGVELALEDDSQIELIKQEILLRRDGSFDAVIDIPLNAVPDVYSLSVYFKGDRLSSNIVTINILRSSPPFSMEFVKPQKDFIKSDIPIFNLKANYLTGIPAASLRGKWELYKKPYYYGFHPEDAYFSFGKADDILCWKGGCPETEENAGEGEFVFDRDGLANIVLSGNDGGYLDSDKKYRLRVSASDVNGTQVSGEFSFTISEGEYHLGMSLKHYILKSGSEAEGLLMLLNQKNEYVQDRRLSLSLVSMENGSEGKSWYDKIVTTDSSPTIFTIPIVDKIPSGMYKLKAKVQDGEAFAELYVYIISEDGNKLSDEFAVYSDQAEYFIGGKALLLVHHPQASAENPVNALLTYERGGILGYKMVELMSPVTQVDIPVTKEMAPNMYVEAMVMNSDKEGVKSFMETQEKRRSETEKMQAEVDIILLEDELESLQESQDPDEKKIDETKNKIEKLKSEIQSSADNIAAASEAYEIKPEIKIARTGLLVNMRDREIMMDVTAEPANPAPGDKVKIKIRAYDYQNRPIQSVIALNVARGDSAQFLPLTPFEYFFQPRGSQISSASNICVGGSPAGVSPAVNLNDVASGDSYGDSGYFNPIILTDENGNAETEFDLPLGYANWNVIASATSGAEKFGIKTLPLHLNKSIYVRPVVPAFAISGDNVRLGAILHNISDGEVQSKIELIMEGADIQGASVKDVKVGTGETAKADWDIKIKDSGDLKSVKAVFKTDEGIVSADIPLKRPQISESVGESGIMENGWEGQMRVPKEAVSAIGGLSVAVSGTPASIIGKYADKLRGDGFSDIDKSAGDLLADSIMRDIETDREAKSKFDEKIGETAKIILASQSANGGFAYWKGAEESPWLTAYILFALQKSGISGESLKSAANYLWSEISKSPGMSVSEKIFILWALSESGEYDTEAAVNIFQSRVEASITDNALLLSDFINLYNAGQKSLYPYIEKLKAEIMDAKTADDEYVFFEDSSQTGKNTAAVLMALNGLSEKSPEADSIFRYLVSQKFGGSYRHDQLENTLLMLALSGYSPEETGSASQCRIKIKANGKTLAEGALGDSIMRGYLSMESLYKGDRANDISIEKDCSIPVYFSAAIEYFPENSTVSPVEDDMLLVRDYYALEDSEMMKPLDSMQSGMLYRGVLTLIVPQNLSNAVLEESLPAGFKALYMDPDIADLSARFEQEKNLELEGLNWPDNPVWNFDRYVIADDRITLIAKELPAGVYTVDYIVQAGLSGNYNHLPAYSAQINNPAVFARTAGGWMKIE